MGKMRLPFIDSDSLYTGALKGRFDCIMNTIMVRTKLYVKAGKTCKTPALQIASFQ